MDADKGRLRLAYCGEFKSMETGRIVVPASRRTRTSTDLSPKTVGKKGMQPTLWIGTAMDSSYILLPFLSFGLLFIARSSVVRNRGPIFCWQFTGRYFVDFIFPFNGRIVVIDFVEDCTLPVTLNMSGPSLCEENSQFG